jgi:hypothetical protein
MSSVGAKVLHYRISKESTNEIESRIQGMIKNVRSKKVNLTISSYVNNLRLLDN